MVVDEVVWRERQRLENLRRQRGTLTFLTRYAIQMYSIQRGRVDQRINSHNMAKRREKLKRLERSRRSEPNQGFEASNLWTANSWQSNKHTLFNRLQTRLLLLENKQWPMKRRCDWPARIARNTGKSAKFKLNTELTHYCVRSIFEFSALNMEFFVRF